MLNPIVVAHRVKSVVKVRSAKELASGDSAADLTDKGTVIVFIPGQVNSTEEIPEAAEAFIGDLLDTVKFVLHNLSPNKVFALTHRVFAAETDKALAQAPLHGLAQIIASEHPDLWGGLIDGEDWNFPIQAIKYIHGQDIIRIDDGIPRTARLRPLPRDKLLPTSSPRNFLPARMEHI